MIRAVRTPLFACCFLHSLAIIPHSVAFVKGFSKTFLSFFAPLSKPERKCPNSIPHSLAFVKRFFKSFLTFFVISFRSVSLRLPARGQLAYYSTSPSFCQHLFAKFFHFGEGGRGVQIVGMVFVHRAQQTVSSCPTQGNARGL